MYSWNRIAGAAGRSFGSTGLHLPYVVDNYIRGRYSLGNLNEGRFTVTNPDPSDLLPIPVAQLHILLALADGDKHGYAIMSEVEVLTGGSVTVGPGTLYGAIKRMLKAGLVEETDERPDPELDDERRRYYRLTGLGERVLDAEVARMEQLARAARMRRTVARQKFRLEGG